MVCHHHPYRRIVGVALSILLVFGFVGEMSGLLGTKLADDAGALDAHAKRKAEERLLQSAERRRLRRTQRLSQSETSALLRQNQSKKWEVALDTGTLSYSALHITAPIEKPSPTQWQNRNWALLEEQMQFGLLYGVVAYPHSPSLGARGNIIIAGHSSAPTAEAQGSAYQDIFARLPAARIGDRIELRDAQGQAFVYEVYDTKAVPATQTSLLLQDEGRQDLTLMTCYPVGTTRERWIVKAKLV